MLRALDPHSNFLDKTLYKSMKEEQRGSFYGLGIEVYKRGDFITVKRPLEGTPAFKMGVLAGDRITEIDGESTMDMPLEEAVSKLKGPLGTKVSIKIKRYGVAQPIPMTLSRAKIATASVANAFLLRPDVGYIQLKNFTQQTQSELAQAVEQLSEKGAQSLILDLRGNPGGLLDQAVRVSESFLRKGDMVVYTKGRLEDSNRTFTSTRDPIWKKPLIVLADHRSASASEIVAGAIQDHDRGLIIGQRTWGKGLVQSVYPLLEFDSALALTTAKYYTPSGRCIQRDYTQSFDEYNFPEEEVFQRLEEGEGGRDEAAYKTDAGREVYASGGIKPDFEVVPEKLNDFLRRLHFQKDAFFNFAVRYSKDHPKVQKDFVVDDELLNEFKNYIKEEGVTFDEKQFIDSKDNIVKSLRIQIVSVAFGSAEGLKATLLDDRDVQKALELLPEAQKLAMQFESATSSKRAEKDPNVNRSPAH
jgi:carboxyl-terminal processing protease